MANVSAKRRRSGKAAIPSPDGMAQKVVRYCELQAACKAAYGEMDDLLSSIVSHYGAGAVVQVVDGPAVVIVDQFAERDFAWKMGRFNRFKIEPVKAGKAGAQ